MGEQQRRSTDQSSSAGEVLESFLSEAGARVVFDAGGPAARGKGDLRRISLPSIYSAATAAVAYAMASRRLSVLRARAPFEAMNVLGVLARARRHMLPIVLLVESPVDGPLTAELLAAASVFCAQVHTLEHASSLPNKVSQSLSMSRGLGQGPVVFVTPPEVLAAPIHSPRMSHAAAIRFVVRPKVAEAAAWALERSASKLIFAGADTRAGVAPRLLLELAEFLQAPVATSAGAKGVFPEDHPLAVGVLEPGGNPSALELAASRPETVLIIGAQGAPAGLKIEAARTLIQVSRRSLPGSLPTTIAVTAPPEVFLREMLERVRLHGPARSFGVCQHPAPADPGEDLLTPARALEVFSTLLPSERSFVVDGLLDPLQRLVCRAPEEFLWVEGGRGDGIAAALGMRAADPERPVVAFVDGRSLSRALASLELALSSEQGLLVVGCHFARAAEKNDTLQGRARRCARVSELRAAVEAQPCGLIELVLSDAQYELTAF